jgi:hypothetical protein
MSLRPFDIYAKELTIVGSYAATSKAYLDKLLDAEGPE